ncbi:MAG: nickel-responsive transcriptional regulator NikR [Endomicrobiales bacterium]|nr:nickel-responsive transcriptional regulator NikR [Endomicrobiales bacterium]
MSKVRFGLSIDKKLAQDFDHLSKARKHSNRSKAIEDLMRQELLFSSVASLKGNIAGAFSMVYNHHRRDLVNKIIDIQHDAGDVIISSQHVHLDHNNCLEILVLKGNAELINKLTDTIRAQKGVTNCGLIIASHTSPAAKSSKHK